MSTDEAARQIETAIGMLATEILAETDDTSDEAFGRMSRTIKIQLSHARRRGLIEAWQIVTGREWDGDEIDTRLRTDRPIELPEGVVWNERTWDSGTFHRTTCGSVSGGTGSSSIRVKYANNSRICQRCKPDLGEDLTEMLRLSSRGR